MRENVTIFQTFIEHTTFFSKFKSINNINQHNQLKFSTLEPNLNIFFSNFRRFQFFHGFEFFLEIYSLVFEDYFLMSGLNFLAQLIWTHSTVEIQKKFRFPSLLSKPVQELLILTYMPPINFLSYPREISEKWSKTNQIFASNFCVKSCWMKLRIEKSLFDRFYKSKQISREMEKLCPEHCNSLEH